MTATIRNLIASKRARREEGTESGFSLIELIIVVAILGILVAIAIPVFTAIDGNAKDNAAKAVASNAATQAAAQIVSPDESVSLLEADDDAITVEWVGGAPTEIADICVRAQHGTRDWQYSGPNCP